MKNIVPTDSRYVPLTQQKWCCVPTCLQMIMYRHNIPLVPAELIGYHIGLTVPKKEARYFWNVRTGKKPLAGWGTRIGEKEFELNTTFKTLKIPLKINLKLIDQFSDLKSFKDYLRSVIDKDILVCFDWGTLFNEGHHGGHVCVLDKIYLVEGKVRIVDPENKSCKWRIVKIEKLYNAMKFHGAKKSAGFWEVSVIS